MNRGIGILIVFVFICLLPSHAPAGIDFYIEGVVVDKDTGKPISGAHVQFQENYRGLGCSTGKQWFNCVSGDDGYFKVYIDSSWDLLMECWKRGYITYRPKRYDYLSRDNHLLNKGSFMMDDVRVRFMRIELKRGGILRGTFLKKVGDVISPLKVECMISMADESQWRRLGSDTTGWVSCFADSNGYLEHSSLLLGLDYKAFIKLGNGYPSIVIRDIRLTRNKICDISRTFDFTNGGGIEGVISIGGQPPEIFNIEIDNEFEQSHLILPYNYFPQDNDGHYMFRVLEPGKYKLILDGSGPGGYLDHYEEIVEIKAGEIVKKDFHFKGKQ
jgi:hypothetical protein